MSTRRATVFAIVLGTFLPVCLGGSGNWPSYIGPGGTRTPERQGYDLVDDLNQMSLQWVLNRHTTVGKGLYPGTLRNARKYGIEPFYGGASNVIAADGLIFLNYYKPDGKTEAKATGWRTVSNPRQYLPDWFFSVTADDCLLAIDAETGKVAWQAVEKGKGLNALAHKRAHWSVSPAWDKGRVFSMGSMGLLYAYDAKSGKKLWETRTNPYLEKVRQEHIQQKKLVWGHAQYQSSLVVADDVVIVAREKLSGYSAKDGKKLWETSERIMTGHATPQIWSHRGRQYVLTHTATSGELRLVDPKKGTIIWKEDGIGPNLSTTTVVGDIVILPFASTKAGLERRGVPKLHRYGAMKLSLEGAERIWTLPDEPPYWQHWHPDKGPRYRVAARDGKAYMSMDLESEVIGGARRGNLVVVDVKTGKIISEQKMARGGVPCLYENRILMLQDYAHTDPVTLSYWTAEDKPRLLNETMALPYTGISGYYIPIEPTYYKGRIYCRSLRGLHCYDLRKPEPDASGQIEFQIPSKLTGQSDRTVNLYLRDGKISHAGLEGSGRIHAVDATGLAWDGWRLRGEFTAGLGSLYNQERFVVEAKVNRANGLEGTIEIRQPALDEPIDRAGRIMSIDYQANWMPACTDLFVLEDAAMNRDRKSGRLIVFLTIKDGKIVASSGYADRTTRTQPAVFGEKLQLADGRLRGQLVVRYRADEWTTPLVPKGSSTAGGVYQIDCRLDGKEQLGQYKGTYGVELQRRAPFVGQYLP